MACCDDPHWLSTVVAATERGRPAVSQAVRVTLKDCSPAWVTQPPDDLADLGRVDAGATHQLDEDGAEQVGGMDGREPAAAPAHRAADGFDHDDVGRLEVGGGARGHEPRDYDGRCSGRPFGDGVRIDGVAVRRGRRNGPTEGLAGLCDAPPADLAGAPVEGPGRRRGIDERELRFHVDHYERGV